MVWAKLIPDRLAVVPDRPYLGAAVVILVPDPAAAAVVVLVTNNEAVVIRVLIVIARDDLAARCLFGREMGFCANHRSLPSRWQESFMRPVGQPAGRGTGGFTCRGLAVMGWRQAGSASDSRSSASSWFCPASISVRIRRAARISSATSPPASA